MNSASRSSPTPEAGIELHATPRRAAIVEPLRFTPRPIDPTADAQGVFEWLAAESGAGRSAVLVIVTAVTGPRSRDAGTLMAVLADGRYAGSLSGGCVESAIVAEAIEALHSGARRSLRLGAGSAYVDIQLPCGGALDVLLIPDPDADAIRSAARHLRDRVPVELRRVDGACPSFRYLPRLRVLVAGQGAEAVAMLGQVRAYGGEAVLLTPQASLLEHAVAAGAPMHLLTPGRGAEAVPVDAWTAIVLLFHDHHWEIDFLRSALHGNAFWIGAMGGQRTRTARDEALAAAGCGPEQVARVHSPIGLIRSARDPSTLALSAMSEIVLAFRDACADATSAASI